MNKALTLLAILASCNFSTGTTYDVRGTVLEVREKTVVLDHEPIDDFMEAMVMPFGADPNLLKSIQRGDIIEAKLLVTDRSSQLIGIEQIGKVDLPEPTPPPFEALKVGDVLAAMTLPSQNGPLQLGADQGITTVLSFLFTSCPMPEFCPLLATKLVGLQQKTGNSARIVVVTLDPERDTFDVLEKYGNAVGAEPNTWHYVREDLDKLTPLFEAVEMTLSEREGELLHSLKLLVLDPQGKLMFLAKNNGWDLDVVASAVEQANR